MTRTATQTYAQHIGDALGNHDPATVALVEDLMRDANGGTLDQLTSARFNRSARNAMAMALEIALAGELKFYCETLNLDVPTLRV